MISYDQYCCLSESNRANNELPLVCEFIQNEAPKIIQSYYYRRLNHADADDLTQDTLIKAWTRCRTLKDSKRVSSWIYGIARRRLSDHFRRKERLIRVELSEAEDANDAYSAAEKSTREFRIELLKWMKSSNSGLTMDQINIIESLNRGERLVDYAKRNGISISTVRTKIQRAREKMKKAVDSQCRFKRDTYARVIDCDALRSPKDSG